MPDSDSDPSPDSKPAPRLGSYLLVQPLGSGGMSNVFRAVHEESGNIVAVKVLPRTLAKNVTLLQRFIREAKSAEALDHPNIVAIYDRGFDQGRHYLVLEYVEGRDLHDRVRLNGPLAPDEAVRFIREVAEGLRYAAGQGMVHRDVKPANLLMTPDSHAKIIDLGLALQTDDEDERVTRDGTTVGTVDYMAPEQARDSRQTSERSDIYSLGCTFYYLLTGSAPYPGGGLADKLARHYKAPIPDVRDHRADVSESLSLLIRKMMEKKPERRFADYSRLIEALDAVSDPSAQGVQGIPLDALIVDDDDDEDEIGLAPTESAISRRKNDGSDRPPSTRDHLMAEIVEDDDDDAPPPAAPPSSRPGKSSPRREPSRPAEVSLSELAALDAEDVEERRQARRSSGSTPVMKTSGLPATPRPPVPPLDAMLEEEDDDEPVYGSSGPPRRSGDELPLKTWIAAGLLVGLSIAIVGFGVSMVVSMTKPPPPEVTQPTEPTPESQPSYVATPSYPNNRTKGPIAPTKKADTSTKAQEPPPVVVVAPEPPPVEMAYPSEWESRLFPPPAVKEPALPDHPKILVRRVAEAGDEPQTSSLAYALGRAGDMVEIADTGPFFEDDCQVAGKSRLIRARAGIRPIIKIELTGNEIVKDQAAKFVLGGTKVDQLVLEGLDISVDVRDLPDRQNALFLCQGASLTIRDCSVTILNANDPTRGNRFSIFRVEEGAKPNRIVLERSTIRGPVRTLFDVAAARAKVVLDRSLVVGDSGPLISLEPAEKADRMIVFNRSLVVTKGPMLELNGRSSPPAIRALGSTFAKLEGTNTAALIASKVASQGEPKTVIDWSGEDNTFVGWPSWMTAGPEASIRVPRLDRVKLAWSGSDGSSREVARPWPAIARGDEVVPADFARLAPDRRGTLIRIATPHPMLHDLTITSIARLLTPELSSTLIPPIVPQAMLGAMNPVRVAPPPPPPPPSPNQTGPRLKNPPAQAKGEPAKPKPLETLDLVFDVQDPSWAGDLGRFLADKLVEGTIRATIRVKGGGVYAISPIRLPDKLSIAILGESAEGSKTPMPTFVPKPDASGRSMIELRGGDLALVNLGFATDGVNRPKHWVLVEDGLLGIQHCRFRDPGGVDPNVGATVVFLAKGASPIVPRIGPFTAATDRPTARLKNCLIWTGGDAISAEVGRGVVDLENCLIISGGPAVSLRPQKVERDKFEADLVMERCTIADDKTGILLGPWPGDPAGPSRPWLVSTRSCVFPRTQSGGAGALLQVDPDAMARGALFWQSASDAYEVAHFLAPTGPPPANIPPADVKKQWIDLWGLNHTRRDRGPDPRRNEVVLRYQDKDRPKPGKVVPSALELDSKTMKDIGVDFKNLPPAPKT